MKNFNPWFIISTMLVQVIFLAIINTALCTHPDVAQLKSFLTLANLVLIALSIIVVLAIRNIVVNYRWQIEGKLLRVHLLEVQQLLETLQEEKYNTIRHFETIGSLLHLNQSNKALDYTDRITNHLSKVSDLPPIQHLGLYALLASRQKTAETKGIQFKVNLQCDLDRMKIKSWDLCSVTGNLLDNALDAVLSASGSNKYIELNISEEGNWSIITVSNTGRRIKPAERSKLFQPGYTTKDSPARGFGLYAVRKIIDQYGGAIDVTSDTLTTFKVYLPNEGANRIGEGIVNQTWA